MKTKLILWHYRLVRDGYYQLARYLLRRFQMSNGEVITIDIRDGDNEAYESGFAGWLQQFSFWHNKKYGFAAKLTL